MPQRRHTLAALRGSIPPLVTPFTSGAVDYDTLRASSSSFRSSRARTAFSSTARRAEPSTLTTDERNRLVTLAIEVTDGPRAGRRRDGLAVARRKPRARPSTRCTPAPTRC